MTDEARLAQDAARGDAAALEHLIRRLSAGVYRFLNAMLGDPHQTDEALQEVFVRMTRALGRIEPDTDVEAWSYAVARRVAGDVRPTGRTGPSSPPYHDRLVTLGAPHREVLVFQDVLGWPPGRVAALLGITPDEVRRRLAAAREELTAARPAGHQAVSAATIDRSWS